MTKAIVLSSIKYSDNSLIVRCLTQDFGVRSYMLKGVLSPRKKGMSPAYFQSFNQLEIVENLKSMGGLFYIKEVKLGYSYQTLHTDVRKSAVILFLSEVCNDVCNVEHPDADLYYFLENTICFFDQNFFEPNFHLKFLLELTAYLGFYPDKNDIKNALFFNLEEGIFSDHCPTANYISGEELLLFKRILQASYTDLSSILINRNDRNQLLLHILRYYQWHFPGFKHKKSLDVLQMLFL